MATSDRRQPSGQDDGEPPPGAQESSSGPRPPTRRALWGQLAALAAVNAVVGTTVGATSVAAGLSVTMAIVLTVFLFAGAAQLAALAVLMASGTLITAWFVVMLVNARFLILAGCRKTP